LPTKIHSALSAIDSFAIQEFFTYRAAQHYHPASEFLFDSPHVHGLRPFKEYAQTSLRGKNALDGLSALMELIHHDFLYESQSTEVNTPLMEVFKQKRGVCQDFAHIMIACCRACGLPARYVSGYLLTQAPEGQARLIGSDASHAWASVFLPILGGSQGYWFDFDPTNNRFGLGSPGEDYVKLAWGRDYSDISPIRGVIQGGKDHQLQVAVTVMPEN
jgi:transglutaminase-like putative cysteine protease